VEKLIPSKTVFAGKTSSGFLLRFAHFVSFASRIALALFEGRLTFEFPTFGIRALRDLCEGREVLRGSTKTEHFFSGLERNIDRRNPNPFWLG